jgi:hypothetical protein
VGRTQTARATKYIEFHGGVRLPHVYLPAPTLHITESAASGWLPQAGAAHGEEATAAGANSNIETIGNRNQDCTLTILNPKP